MTPIGDRDDPLDSPGDELAFHVEQQVEDLVAAGWDPGAARAEALRRFGDPRRVRRTLERMGKRRRRMALRREWLDGLAGDLAFAVRQMRRSPGFAMATVLVLALGVGIAGGVFAVADTVVLRPLPFPEPEELVLLHDASVRTPDTRIPPALPEFRDWEREGGSFLAGVVAFASNGATLSLGERPEAVLTGLVGGDLSRVLGLDAVVGRSFTQEELAGGWEAGVVLLDEDYWRGSLGGDPGIVGRTVRLDGEPTIVVGVLPGTARLPFQRAEIAAWRPMPDSPMLSRDLHLLTVVGRLDRGLDFEEARQRAETMAAGLRESGVTTHGIALEPLRAAVFGDVRRVVLILAGAVGLVLLVVAANLGHLFLARSWARSHEFAVRGSLGAGRGRLVRQLLVESTLLALLGAVAGSLLARAITGWVARATGRTAVSELATGGDWRIVAFALTAAVVLGVACGWFPGRSVASVDPARELRSRSGGDAAGRARLRRVLLGTEVALCVTLLAGAGLLVRSLHGLLAEDTGFETAGVLTAAIRLPDSRYDDAEKRVAFWRTLRERLDALAGVEATGFVDHVPLTGDTNGGFEIVGRETPEDERPQTKKRFASPGFFEAMGIPLLRGRVFLDSDVPGAPEVAVISASLAERYWPGEDPIGKRIRFLWKTEEEQTIVGVVGDVRSDALDVPEQGTIYLASEQVGEAGLSVVLKTSVAPGSLVEPLRRTVQELDPELPIRSPRTLEAVLRESVAERTTLMELLSVFGLLSLVLAAVGVYAVASQTVLARTREIGLRMALGARAERVSSGILRREIGAIAIGLAVGLAGAVYAGRALSGFLHGVAPTDVTTLIGVVVTLLTASVLALLLPLLRALRVDPMVALRSD